MKPKSFIAFSSVTAILVVAAIVAVAMRPAPTLIPKERDLVFPGLEERLNDVAALEIVSAERSFTLHRLDDGWGIKELDDFPANFDKVKTALVQLAQLRYLEAKTTDPARFDRLHLRDVTEKGARSRRVVVRDGNGEVLAEGLIGKRNDSLFGTDKGGTYLRVDDEGQTWLAEGIVALGEGPPDWISKALVDVKSDRIKRLVIMSPKGGGVVVSRESPTEKDFTLHDIPPGKNQRGQWETNQMPKALEGVELLDIGLASETPFPEDGVYEGRFETFDGLVVETRAAKLDKKYWTGLSASAPEDADEAVKKRAEEINSRLKGYVFEVEEDMGKKLTCEHVNLLEGAGVNACA